jgi:phage head maturation protease
MLKFYGAIRKVDSEQRMVWGYASTEAQDDQGETILRSALVEALDDYMKAANVREMHQLSAVGVAKEASVDDKGLYLGAKIVDDDAWHKVIEGVYKGFSVGGRALARDPANRNVITKMRLSEISLVDRPCNPEAVFDCWKAAGGIVDLLEGNRAAEVPGAPLIDPGAIEHAFRKALDNPYRGDREFLKMRGL